MDIQSILDSGTPISNPLNETVSFSIPKTSAKRFKLFCKTKNLIQGKVMAALIEQFLDEVERP